MSFDAINNVLCVNWFSDPVSGLLLLILRLLSTDTILLLLVFAAYHRAYAEC